MHEIIEEGKARIKVKKVKRVSKEMRVFYNKVMKHNRDISVLLLNCSDKNGMQAALPLAGTGVRGIRFLLELNKNKIENISFNDYSKDAVKSIKNNLSLSIEKNSLKMSEITKKAISEHAQKLLVFDKINTKIRITNEDANLFLLNSTGFDYIDLDPFGSPNFLLNNAIVRLSRDGILAVTATDTAALTGTYPKVCRRKYWAEPLRNEMMHEIGLRILIRKIQLVGGQYEKALIPIFSYFKDHYFRVFFKCVKGKKDVDKVIGQHGFFDNAGPLWLGKLWDNRLVNKMYQSIKKESLLKKPIKNKPIFETREQRKSEIQGNRDFQYPSGISVKSLIKFIKIVKDEAKVNTVGFYDIHKLVKRNKIKKIPKKEELIKKIKKKGCKVSETHFSDKSLRSDIQLKDLIKLLRR